MAKHQGKQKQTLLAERRKKRKVRSVVWIGGDEELAAELREAQGRRQRLANLIEVRGDEASTSDRRALAELEVEIEQKKEALRDTAIKFVFEAIGRNRYDKLIKEHPPTPEQIAKAKEEEEQATFNEDTFPAALVDACCIEPEHEPGELGQWIFEDPDDEWNMAEQMELFHAAINVNMNRVRVDLGKG